ncbi:MAG: hypothetical protein U9P80_08540 [Thermodesulfobacteriota bacterium]|nr:hypothetical protein [Thermodesulfobacteriota bacterium]
MREDTALAEILPQFSLNHLFTYWPITSTVLGNVWFFVILITILTLFILCAILMIKYVPFILKDIKNLSNQGIPSFGLKLWIALIIVLPAFFNAGPLWFALWWIIILWGYVNKAEKKIAWIIIFTIMMSSWIAHIGAGFVTYAQTGMNREIFFVEHGIETPRDTICLASWIKDHPADAEPMNALAKTKGDKFRASAELIHKALDLNPDNPRYYNNLGITLIHMGKDTKAIQSFKNSATLDPNDMVYHYNLSRLYQSMYNFSEAQNAIARAGSIDPKRVSLYLDQEEHRKNRYIHAKVPVPVYLARQMHQSSELQEVSGELWAIALGVTKKSHAMPLAACVALILFLLDYMPKEKFTKQCSRCGNLFYAGTTSTTGLPLCLQCHWINTKSKDHMNPVINAKIEEIKQFRSNISSYTARLDLVLPGMGCIIGNKTSRGVFRVLILSMGIIMVITGGCILSSFIQTGLHPCIYIRITGVVILAVLYLRAWKSPPIHYDYRT